jgi:acyl-coenzyme A thioesterase PaaI-like protein
MPEALRRLAPTDPRRVIGRGHPVGDILEAYDWEVLHRGVGHLRIAAHVPAAVRNPRGQLFGGFTGTYVDFMSIFTFWAGREDRIEGGRRWLATLNMRVDYFKPVLGPRFEMEGRVVHLRGGTGMIETRFYESPDDGTDSSGGTVDVAREGVTDLEPNLLVYGYTTLKISG